MERISESSSVTLCVCPLGSSRVILALQVHWILSHFQLILHPGHLTLKHKGFQEGILNLQSLQWYSEVTWAPVISPTMSRGPRKGVGDRLAADRRLLLNFLDFLGVLKILGKKQTKSHLLNTTGTLLYSSTSIISSSISSRMLFVYTSRILTLLQRRQCQRIHPGGFFVAKTKNRVYKSLCRNSHWRNSLTYIIEYFRFYLSLRFWISLPGIRWLVIYCCNCIVGIL